MAQRAAPILLSRDGMHKTLSLKAYGGQQGSSNQGPAGARDDGHDRSRKKKTKIASDRKGEQHRLQKEANHFLAEFRSVDLVKAKLSLFWQYIESSDEKFELQSFERWPIGPLVLLSSGEQQLFSPELLKLECSAVLSLSSGAYSEEEQRVLGAFGFPTLSDESSPLLLNALRQGRDQTELTAIRAVAMQSLQSTSASRPTKRVCRELRSLLLQWADQKKGECRLRSQLADEAVYCPCFETLSGEMISLRAGNEMQMTPSRSWDALIRAHCPGMLCLTDKGALRAGVQTGEAAAMLELINVRRPSEEKFLEMLASMLSEKVAARPCTSRSSKAAPASTTCLSESRS